MTFTDWIAKLQTTYPDFVDKDTRVLFEMTWDAGALAERLDCAKIADAYDNHDEFDIAANLIGRAIRNRDILCHAKV